MVSIAVQPAVESAANTPNLAAYAELAGELERSFGTPLTLWAGESGQCLYVPPGQPNADEGWRGAVARVVAEQTNVEIIAEDEALVVLAVTIAQRDKHPLVATGTFVLRHLSPSDDLTEPARILGLDPATSLLWINSQRLWTVDLLLRMAESVAARYAAQAQAQRSAWEVEKISENLAATYEEICLLHEMANHLRLSQSDDELGRLALERLITCLPARGAAIHFLPVADAHDVTYKARTRSELLTLGNCPLDEREFARLVQHLDLNASCGPFVANRDITSERDWPFANVRQLILTPLSETDKLFGWMAIFNHIDDNEFGSVEASLLSSVGAILGIHCGNRDLYRLQDEFLASVVRAMTSAIDAKDPYTCGHSDRVARIAVRLAQQLGFSTEDLANIYMAGLLHDVGKIGIDDQVLRKHGKLTTEEFEHIKEHPDLGCKILADLKPLAAVLPAVRHHHEQWDGRGYPSKLSGDEIPLIARIVAVADAFDAMVSDRPYRQGMPIEKVEEIFNKGAAQQWDKQVVEAYFVAREDIREISRRERANLSLDVTRWT